MASLRTCQQTVIYDNGEGRRSNARRCHPPPPRRQCRRGQSPPIVPTPTGFSIAVCGSCHGSQNSSPRLSTKPAVSPRRIRSGSPHQGFAAFAVILIYIFSPGMAHVMAYEMYSRPDTRM
ncbi:hypothetical protein PsYK624_166410 [Phanerochaete sordida]|uniref:Uncharacterized protein n=1 Tax=Phanerochaete sordida TaxID=48140 RepID=A0A9P3GR82_9APHY|nr:hypothetical protein PsYK624_166410 [Phanerochaete sordida]